MDVSNRKHYNIGKVLNVCIDIIYIYILRDIICNTYDKYKANVNVFEG
jgi:hypothetical protein